MRYIIFILFIFTACQEPKKLTFATQVSLKNQQNISPLEYLNSIKKQSNMIEFKYNKILELSAKNHAIYEIKNKHFGHDEDENMPFFTGHQPYIRANKVGYSTKNVSENISYNQNIISSIDSLFTAIYHRFGFLSFDKDEIGFFYLKENNSHVSVFNMGNSYHNKLCKNGGDNGYGKFYINTCKDENVKILQKRFDHKFDNANIVYFPNNFNAQIAFSGEDPDPMPTCKITANPISVQFSSDEKSVKMTSFKLFKDKKQIKDVKIITQKNDVNSKFTDKQFALFSLKTLEFDSFYEVLFEYEQENKNKKLQWYFKTTSPKNQYFAVNGGENLAINANEKYDIFFIPQNCMDLVNTYKITSSSHVKIKTEHKNKNMISISADGFIDDEISLSYNGKK